MSGLDVASLRVQLREGIGLEGDDVETLPDVDLPNEKTGADTYLNRAFWEVLDKFHFREKEKISSFSTAIGEEFYKIPSSFEALQSVAIEDPDTNKHDPLDRITADVFEQKFVNNADDQGKPTHYLRESNGIRLWRVPDLVYTIILRYWCELADLSDTNDPPIPRTWHEVILFGGVWRAFIGVNGDYTRAQAAKAHQIALVNSMEPAEAKEEFDSHRAGIELPSELTDI